ncbi:MAG: hypothetical protein EDM05_000520 [Leptolyngbya sp. IPPAS B-1204]
MRIVPPKSSSSFLTGWVEYIKQKPAFAVDSSNDASDAASLLRRSRVGWSISEQKDGY